MKIKKLLIFVIVGVLALGIGTSIQVRANPIQEYESIERVNYEDDNWEFTSFPFTINDNWQEYGLRLNVSFGEMQLSGVGYFSSVYTVTEGENYYSVSIPTDFYEVDILVLDFDIGNMESSYIFTAKLIGESVIDIPLNNVSGWIELIRVIPNINTEYNVGFNEGYSRGVSQNFSSFGSFLTNSVGGFLNFEIFPGFSIMNVLWAILGVLLFIIILRVFAGG